MMNRTPQQRYLQKPFPGSSHSWAIDQVKDLPPDARVLDVGPGSGIMGSILKEQGIEELFAVEIDADAREHVAPLYQQVEESIAPFLSERFDCILLLDVLEHMDNPFGFFETVASLLSENGRVLVSLPNIAHWSVRFPLLFGFFEYTDRGILDRTHLQFFNRRRFLQLLRSAPHTSMVSTAESIEPVEFVLPKFLWSNPLFRFCSKIRVLFAALLPGLMAYQLLGVVKRSSTGDS